MRERRRDLDGTKLGVHSCRSDLPADNCVAFPQMACTVRPCCRTVVKNTRCISRRECDTRERNLAVADASLSQAGVSRGAPKSVGIPAAGSSLPGVSCNRAPHRCFVNARFLADGHRD